MQEPVEATEPPRDTTPGCLTVGSGVRVRLGGRTIEGPRRTPCIQLAPGAHALRVESSSTGELLWERSVEIRAGDARAITAHGVR